MSWQAVALILGVPVSLAAASMLAAIGDWFSARSKDSDE